jgi:hypothetical protein
MEESGGEGTGIELKPDQDKSYLEGVLDIGFARFSDLPFVGFTGKFIGSLDNGDLLRWKIRLRLFDKLIDRHNQPHNASSKYSITHVKHQHLITCKTKLSAVSY